MRYSTVAIAAALTLATISTTLHGQRQPDPVSPRSLQFLERGRQAAAAGNLDAATDALETAVTIDPHNRAAFVALGDVSRRRNLPGNAIRLYREALSLDGNDRAALRGQGQALVARGAIDRARANLAKIRTLCGTGACPDAAPLSQAIAAGAPPASTQVARVIPTVIPPAPAPTATPTAAN